MKHTGLLMTPENYDKCDDRSKRMTRRIMTPQPGRDVEWFAQLRSGGKDDGLWFPMKGDPKDAECWEQASGKALTCPYGTVGDRLYVKEGLYCTTKAGHTAWRRDGKAIIPYRNWQWQRDTLSPLHMPKWAARLWLEITEIRVERLQAISNADALAEGCVVASPHRHGADGMLFEESASKWIKDPYADRHNTGIHDCHICPFRMLWHSIYGPGAWERNPYVWVIGFTKVTP